MPVETPTKTRKPKAEKPKAEPKPKVEKAPKVEPEFTSAEVMGVAKEYAASARDSITEFGDQIKGYSDKANADPKTYRDAITTIKYVERRVERLTLSLDELEAGLKVRKVREPKPRPEGAAKRGRPKKVKEETPAEVDDEDTLDEDDEDMDLDD